MNKLIKPICIALTIILLAGCTPQKNTPGNTGIPSNTTAAASGTTAAQTVENLHIKDYFPIKENVKYTFEGKGNEFASYTLINDYTASDMVQQRIDNGGTETVKVMVLKDGKLMQVLSRGETYYRENFLSKTYADGEVLLMEPLVKGTTWSLKDSRTRIITDTAKEITTPSGTYKAIEVTTEGKDGKTLDYYASGTGLVKTVFNPGESEISSSLKEITENQGLTQNINFYYPNINDEKIYFETKQISFKSNDITKSTLEKAYKALINTSYGKVLSTNTKINSLYLNESDGMVHLDLSSDFLKEMNAGANYERMILQSIANTFGQYYGINKVILTIDNKLYESGHTALKKGEALTVSTEGTVEIKK